MMRQSLLRSRPFRESKLADKSQLVLAKKVVELDHLAIDANGLVATALRMSKNVVTEKRKHSEVARYVCQSLHLLIKRFAPKRSLAIFMDGAEPLWKAQKTRSSTVTKRVEGRLMRLPATPLMLAVEERIARMAPDNRLFPTEVIFSGTSCDGPVEKKMTAWALDLASRDSCKSSDSIALIGASELALNIWGITPFFNISNIVQNGNDFKQLRAQDVLEWLDLDKRLKGGDTVGVARMRTDALFLYCLTNGVSATEMPVVPLSNFGDLMEAYSALVAQHQHQSSAAITTPPAPDSPGSGSASATPTTAAPQAPSPAGFLFESAGNELLLDVPFFITMLQTSTKRAASVAQADPSAAEYLELALQSHAMLCHGWVPNELFTCKYSTTPSIQTILSHLRSLGPESQKLFAQKSAEKPLTSAEFTILSYSIPASIDAALQQIVGLPPKPDIGRQIAGMSDATLAASHLRKVLKYAVRPHKSLHYAPAYCWLQSERSKLWSFHYVDIGSANKKLETRRKKGESFGSMVSFAVAEDGPASFNPATKAWEPIATWPVGGVSTGNAKDKTAGPRNITVLTWNVMFDRYSGKPTPLGKPGIDWCSAKRYPIISKVLRESDADVIAMQEVEAPFWEFLSKEPWVQESYFLSCGMTGPAITPWGVLIMVHKRVKLLQCTHVNVPAWSSHVCLMPVVTISMAHAPVNIASIHLLAPYTKTHENARSGQDTVLRQKMQKSITGECITIGDYNDWPTNEFTMPAESLFKDSWMMVKPEDPGKTMDETNEFCKLKIEEEFFGRSDKMFLRSKVLVPVEASLVGTKSVNEENGNNKAPGYLFPSDHYGVKIKFSVK